MASHPCQGVLWRRLLNLTCADFEENLTLPEL